MPKNKEEWFAYLLEKYPESLTLEREFYNKKHGVKVELYKDYLFIATTYFTTHVYYSDINVVTFEGSSVPFTTINGLTTFAL